MCDVLNEDPRRGFQAFLEICREMDADVEVIRRVAESEAAYFRGNVKLRKQLNFEGNAIEELVHGAMSRWYESLRTGAPDYGVYDGVYYLGELWACWVVYSRKYLRGIVSPKSLPDAGGVVRDCGEVKRVVDLGCGIGFSTAALRQMYPGAEVLGTNLDGTLQTDFARRMGSAHGFEVCPDVAHVGRRTDVVFASEYFEHIQDPVTHLLEVVKYLQPRVLILANSFGVVAVGHFDTYSICGEDAAPRSASLRLHRELRRLGYEKVQTKLWNSRPAYWRLARRRPRVKKLKER